MEEKNIYRITHATFSQSMEAIEKGLLATGVKQKEVFRASLLLEETFESWRIGLSLTENQPVYATIKKRFGDVNLQLRVKGDKFNPIVDLNDQGDEESWIRLAILKSNLHQMSFSHTNKENVLSIRVHQAVNGRNNLYRTLLCLVLGIVAGLLMRTFMDAVILEQIQTNIIQPVQGIILNSFNLLVTPLMMFSILSGMVQMSDTTDIGKIGRRLVISSLFMLALAAGAGICVSLVIFTKDLSYMKNAVVSGETVSIDDYSFKEMMFDIVPGNLIDPFLSNNVLQVMFLAIFFGLILKKMGENKKWIADVIGFMDRFFMTGMEIVVPLVPVIVFFSMASLVSRAKLEALLPLFGIFFGCFIGIGLIFILSSLFILLVGRISPVSFVRKGLRFIFVPIAINGSSTSLPYVMRFCVEELGISSNMASFLVPLGMQFTKTGFCIFFPMATLMMVQVFQINMNADFFVNLFLSVFLMTLAKPPVSCGGIVCLNYMFATLGIPIEAVAIIFGIEPVAGMLVAGMNAMSNIAVAFCVARTEKRVDEKIYASS